MPDLRLRLFNSGAYAAGPVIEHEHVLGLGKEEPAFDRDAHRGSEDGQDRCRCRKDLCGHDENQGRRMRR